MVVKQFVLMTAMAAAAIVGVDSRTAWAGTNVWTSLGPDGGGATALAVDPKHADTMYAVTFAGLFKSTDGGANWGVTSPLPPNSGVITSLTIDPQNSGTLYAATRQADMGPPADAVFKSTDGGASWRELKSGLLFGLSAPLAIDPQNPNIIYSGGYNDIFTSTDGGATWKTTNSGLPPVGPAIRALEYATPCEHVHRVWVLRNDDQRADDETATRWLDSLPHNSCPSTMIIYHEDRAGADQHHRRRPGGQRRHHGASCP